MANFEKATFDKSDPEIGTIFYITDVFGHQVELTTPEALQLFQWLGTSLASNEPEQAQSKEKNTAT